MIKTAIFLGTWDICLGVLNLSSLLSHDKKWRTYSNLNWVIFLCHPLYRIALLWNICNDIITSSSKGRITMKIFHLNYTARKNSFGIPMVSHPALYQVHIIRFPSLIMVMYCLHVFSRRHVVPSPCWNYPCQLDLILLLYEC